MTLNGSPSLQHDPEMGRAGHVLTVREASELARIPRDVVYQAIDAGQLPHAVIGGAKHLPRRAFETWLRDRSQPGRPEG